MSLLEIRFGGNVARRPLKIVSHRPMALIAELLTNQVGYDWRNAAQLCMAEGVLYTRRKKLTIWSLDPFGDRDNAVIVPLRGLLDFGQEPSLVKRNFGKQQNGWSVAFVVGGERASGGHPASVPTHHFQDEHLSRGATHRRQIERRLPNAGGEVLRR